MTKIQIEQRRELLIQLLKESGHVPDSVGITDTNAVCDMAVKFLEIQARYAEEYRLRDAVKAEMKERGSRGQLWSNNQCKDWQAYAAAVNAREQAVESIVTSP